jgi:hypothetical protein
MFLFFPSFKLFKVILPQVIQLLLLLTIPSQAILGYFLLFHLMLYCRLFYVKGVKIIRIFSTIIINTDFGF